MILRENIFFLVFIIHRLRRLIGSEVGYQIVGQFLVFYEADTFFRGSISFLTILSQHQSTYTAVAGQVYSPHQSCQ